MTRVFLLVCVGLLFSVGVGGAAEDLGDQKIKNMSNQVMMMVYNDILSKKNDYPNLANFDQRVLSINQHGVYAIRYKDEIPEGSRKGQLLEFGVTIVNIDDKNFDEFGHHTFNFQFPLLGIKFAGYTKTTRQRNQFSVIEAVQRNGDPLLDEQGRHLPLKLSLETAKKYYEVGEDIEVIVTLENISPGHLWIRSLNRETLYFVFAGAEWGASELGVKKGEKRIVLKSGEKLQKRFVGSGFSSPEEFEIYCSYGLAFKGVKPSAVLKVKVVDGP